MAASAKLVEESAEKISTLETRVSAMEHDIEELARGIQIVINLLSGVKKERCGCGGDCHCEEQKV